MDSNKKYKVGTQKYINEATELLYMVIKSIFERYSGKRKKVTRTKALKDDYKSDSDIKATPIKAIIKAELEKKKSKLKNEAKKLMDDREGKQRTRQKVASKYTYENTSPNRNRTGFIENVINTVGRQIFTAPFIRSYNDTIEVSDEEVKQPEPQQEDKQPEPQQEEIRPRPDEQREGETDKQYLRRLNREDRSVYGGYIDQETLDRIAEVGERIDVNKERKRQRDIEKGGERVKKELKRQQTITTRDTRSGSNSTDNSSGSNSTDVSDIEENADYNLSDTVLPYSVSHAFQRGYNLIRGQNENNVEYKARLENAVNSISSSRRVLSNKGNQERNKVIQTIRAEIQRLEKTTPPSLQEQLTPTQITQITNSSLNDMARTMANQTIPDSAGPQQLTPAQGKLLDKRRKQLERKFAPTGEKKKTTDEIVIEALLPEVQGARQNISGARQNITNVDIKATQQRQMILDEQRVLDRKLNNIKDVFGQLQPQVERVRRAMENKMPQQKDAKKILTDAQIRDTINTIPIKYRGLLGYSVNEMLSGRFDLGTIAEGMVGLATFMATGSPVVSQLSGPITRYLLDAFDINLNEYLYVPQQQPITVYDSEVKRQLGITTSDPSIETKQEQNEQLGVLQDYTQLRTDEVPGSDSNIDNMVNTSTNELLDNIDTKMKTAESQQFIQTEARNYIRAEFSRFISAIGRQITRRDDSLYDLLQFNEEVVSPLGFYDYLNNIRGLPEAVRQSLPQVGIQELKEAMPVMMDIRRYVPELPRLPMPERFRPGMPSANELREGVYGGIGGAVIPAIARGGAMGGVRGGLIGGLGGTVTAAMISPMIRRYYEQQGSDMNDPKVKRNIQILKALPPAIAGALIGGLGIGENLFSGSGITERKITVDPSVLAETKTVDDQEGKDRKKWITKGIMPTPDILDETQQEKFVDDLEFIAFNYIEPGSEGANGNIKTNALKRAQFLTDQIRYFEAGISTPSMLYNVEFPTNTPQKQMDTYKLGQDMLPEMQFIAQDNADTFNDSNFHFVNNEDTAIEMFSPFDEYSDVRNYWAINRRSDLYNLYA